LETEIKKTQRGRPGPFTKRFQICDTSRNFVKIRRIIGTLCIQMTVDYITLASLLETPRQVQLGNSAQLLPKVTRSRVTFQIKISQMCDKRFSEVSKCL